MLDNNSIHFTIPINAWFRYFRDWHSLLFSDIWYFAGFRALRSMPSGLSSARAFRRHAASSACCIMIFISLDLLRFSIEISSVPYFLFHYYHSCLIRHFSFGKRSAGYHCTTAYPRAASWRRFTAGRLSSAAAAPCCRQIDRFAVLASAHLIRQVNFARLLISITPRWRFFAWAFSIWLWPHFKTRRLQRS